MFRQEEKFIHRRMVPHPAAILQVHHRELYLLDHFCLSWRICQCCLDFGDADTLNWGRIVEVNKRVQVM